MFMRSCHAGLLPVDVQLQVEAVADAPKLLTLDTRDLTLHKVTLLNTPAAAAADAEAGSTAGTEQCLSYALAPKHEVRLSCSMHSYVMCGALFATG